MKVKQKKRVRVIDGADARDFEDVLNEVLDAISDPDITFDRNRPFLAYVTFTETIEIPESVQDAYEMRGEYHFCGECPYWEKPTDRRIKYDYCDLGEKVGEKTAACDLFYKMLNEGTLGKKKIIRR